MYSNKPNYLAIQYCNIEALESRHCEVSWSDGPLLQIHFEFLGRHSLKTPFVHIRV